MGKMKGDKYNKEELAKSIRKMKRIDFVNAITKAINRYDDFGKMVIWAGREIMLEASKH